MRPQGHRGEVIADLLTDFPGRFAGRQAVSLRLPGAEAPARSVTIEHFRLHHNRIVFKFTECASMNEAESLRGFEVVIPWEQRTPLPEDEVYIADLAGCVMIDTRTGQTVGTVVDVDRESSNTALLVVQTQDRGELLVPFVKAYMPRWDLAARSVHMELPAGLLDLLDPQQPAEE